MEKDSGDGMASHVSDIQERMDKLPKKEVKGEPWKDQQQDIEDKAFKFNLNSEIFSLACNTSMTLLEALNTSPVFKEEKDKFKNKDKEVLIIRSKPQMPRVAVKTDFPCCLIDDNEIIDVSFIKNDGGASKQTATEQKLPLNCNADMFVTFYVKKTRGDNVLQLLLKSKVKLLLESKALRDRVEYICVYAFKNDTLETALRRDGRFTRDMFGKHCALYEFGTDSRHEMTLPVTALNGKMFIVIVIGKSKQPDSQEDQIPEVKTESDVTSNADVPDDAGTSQTRANTEHKTKHERETGKTRKRSAPKPIPNSEEILKHLCDQYSDLLQQLKHRENFKKNSQVQKFFCEEFAKSVENFLEIKKVKTLAHLSDAVCQILVEGKAQGTGFLLLDRYVLTNAHVIEPFALCICENPFPLIYLQKTVNTVFNFEDYETKDPIQLSVKNECFAYAKGKDKEDRHLDYAVLELENDAPKNFPRLFNHYSNAPPRAGSQICIVGHPGDGVKKMDPCFIIDLNPQRPATNPYHVITPQYFEKNKITYDSCFTYGSSGSPVFDEHCYLIGMHTGCFTHNESTGTQRTIEYAFSLKPILEDMKKQVEYKEKSIRDHILPILEGASDISSM